MDESSPAGTPAPTPNTSGMDLAAFFGLHALIAVMVNEGVLTAAQRARIAEHALATLERQSPETFGAVGVEARRVLESFL